MIIIIIILIITTTMQRFTHHVSVIRMTNCRCAGVSISLTVH